MTRPNNIVLPNLKIAEKLLYSAMLIGGITIYASTWYYILMFVYADDSTPFSLGVGLGSLAAADADSFHRLLGVHAAGIALLAGASLWLFEKACIRRRVKTILVALAVMLAVLDLSAWLYAPSCSESNLYVGIVGILAAVPMIVLSIVPLCQMWWYRRWQSPDGMIKRVVIIGGGFSGLYAAMGLNKILGYNKDLEITVIDRKNYFLFPPLLPSAAAGTIETRQVSFPFRRIFETTNISFRKVDVTTVDPNARIVSGIVEVNQDASGNSMAREVEFPFDYLVLAPGSITQTFGTPGATEHAFFMRELNDAVLMRNQVIDLFERAAVVSSKELQAELLSFIIVGAGPTGVETATEIYDLIHHVLLKRYPEIDVSIPQVSILQSGEQILPGWPIEVIRIAERQLKKLSINLLLKSRVTEIGPSSVTLKDGTVLPARTIIWCAGVKPSGLLACCGLPTDPSGRIAVDETLRVPGYSHVFVMGDGAHCLDSKTGKPLPPLGQVAFQQGSHTAKNLCRALSNQPLKPFRYFNFGSLVSVGEHFAAVHLFGLRISGIIGWFIWRSLYLAKLVGVSNKIRVVLDWTLDLLIERSISQIRDDAPYRRVIMTGGEQPQMQARPVTTPTEEVARNA